MLIQTSRGGGGGGGGRGGGGGGEGGGDATSVGCLFSTTPLPVSATPVAITIFPLPKVAEPVFSKRFPLCAPSPCPVVTIVSPLVWLPPEPVVNTTVPPAATPDRRVIENKHPNRDQSMTSVQGECSYLQTTRGGGGGGGGGRRRPRRRRSRRRRRKEELNIGRVLVLDTSPA